MDRGTWWATVHGGTRSRTRLSDFTFTFHFHALEKEMTTHSSVLVWRISGTEEPGGLLSMGSHRVGHDWSDLAEAINLANFTITMYKRGPPWRLSGKEPTCQYRRPVFDPWVRKIPWSRKWQPTPVFLPGESQEWGSLVGCRLWGRTESDMTDAT